MALDDLMNVATALAIVSVLVVVLVGRGKRLAAVWAAAWVVAAGLGVGWLVDHAFHARSGLADALYPWLHSLGKLMVPDFTNFRHADALSQLLGSATVLLAAVVAVIWVWSLGIQGRHRARGGDVAPAPVPRPRRVAIRIAGVPLPERLEARGISLVGAPGVGKTQVAKAILLAARQRGDRCIIVDSAGDIMSQLYEDGDTILAPGDARSAAWSPYADLRDVSETETLAASIIPPGHGSGAEWHAYARTLVSAVLRRTLERGETSTGELMHYLTAAPADELESLVRGLPASRLTAAGADKMLSSVLGIVGTHVSAMQYLDPGAGADSWSLRDWSENGEGWLWMPYVDSASEATRSLRRTWLDVLVRGIFDQVPDDGRRTWLILDELHSHGQLDILTAAVARGRKYGLRVVLGYQTASQLREVYGKDGAESIMGCTGHTLILRSPDPDTADRLSRQIGDVERDRVQRSSSSSSSSALGQSGSSSESSTVIRETRRAVLASEIQFLPDLEGYLLIAGTGIGRVRVPVVKGLERRTPPLIRAAAPEPYVPAADIATATHAPELVAEVAVPGNLASLFDDDEDDGAGGAV